MAITWRWGWLLVAMLAAVLAMGLLAGTRTALAQQTPTITFRTQPAPQEILVREEEAQALVEVRDAAGNLVRDAVIDLQINTPPPGLLFGTDLPRVEGTTLVKSRLVAPEGRVELAVLWPMRGTYQVRIAASPAPGGAASFQPVSKEFTLTLPERPGPARNFFILAGVLLGVGLVAGIILGISHRAGRAV